MRIATTFCLALLLVLTGCDSNDGRTIPPTLQQTVFVGSQGNFSDGNGSLWGYDTEADTSGRIAGTLSTIIQGIRLQDRQVYVAANTGGRVDVFDALDGSRTGQLTGLTGPRYLAFANDGAGSVNGYVTDQTFSGTSSVKVFSTEGEQPSLIETIDVSGQPEGITATDGGVYVALGAFGASTEVGVIDPTTQTLATTLDVGCAARSVEWDQSGAVYAFCSDDAQAVRINIATRNVIDRVALPDTAETVFGIGTPTYADAGAQVIYVATDTGVLRVDVSGSTPVVETIDVGDATDIGAVAYNAAQGELYVARVPGFTTAGSVTVHNPADGTETGRFSVGIAPVAFAFE